MRYLVKSCMCAWRIRARRIREGRGQNAPARPREGRESPIPREGRENPIPREAGNPISGAGGVKKSLGPQATLASDARKRRGPVEQGDSKE